MSIRLTGEPATPQFITAQIDGAIARAMRPGLGLGGTVRVSEIEPAPQPLERGFETSFTVTLEVDPSGGATPFAATTVVDITNVDQRSFTPLTLAFRDDPERIAADGVLSRTTVDLQHPTRLYYYHQNTGIRRRFSVVLTANDSVRTRVHVVEAAAGPNLDVMGVGHAVTKTFLIRKPHDEGSIIEVAGGKPLVARDQLVDPGEGIVGSVDVSVLDGGPVTLTVLAVPAGVDPAGYLYAPKLPADGHGRHGDFRLADFAQWVVAYTVGGPDATYVYGQRQPTPPNLDPTDSGHDYGDYGVLQQITFDIANPTSTPVTLFLYEKPLGGVVRSSFIVNGILTDIGCVRIPERYTVAPYVVPARTTAALAVLTMTDGGSNYPLEIGLTMTPARSATPAMRAADGCFPKPPISSSARK